MSANFCESDVDCSEKTNSAVPEKSTPPFLFYFSQKDRRLGRTNDTMFLLITAKLEVQEEPRLDEPPTARK